MSSIANNTHHNNMQIRPNTIDLNSFREELADTSRRVLMLDYDGTLAPFVENRDQAYPYPGVRKILEAIRADNRNRLVIVTGRAVDAVLPLVGMSPAPEIWGSHGYEHRFENGTYERHDVPEASMQALTDATALIVDAGLQEKLEKKPLSIAVHWRGLERDTRDHLDKKVRRLWEGFINGETLMLHEFDGGLELRIPGRTKGDAVSQIISEESEEGLYAYFGDDLTDEDAFAVLKGKGLSVLVRNEPRETRADIRITPPDELLQWLRLWTE